MCVNYIVSLCQPDCPVINFESNLIFLIKPFFLHAQIEANILKLFWKVRVQILMNTEDVLFKIRSFIAVLSNCTPTHSNPLQPTSGHSKPIQLTPGYSRPTYGLYKRSPPSLNFLVISIYERFLPTYIC